MNPFEFNNRLHQLSAHTWYGWKSEKDVRHTHHHANKLSHEVQRSDYAFYCVSKRKDYCHAYSGRARCFVLIANRFIYVSQWYIYIFFCLFVFPVTSIQKLTLFIENIRFILGSIHGNNFYLDFDLAETIFFFHFQFRRKKSNFNRSLKRTSDRIEKYSDSSNLS